MSSKSKSNASSAQARMNIRHVLRKYRGLAKEAAAELGMSPGVLRYQATILNPTVISLLAKKIRQRNAAIRRFRRALATKELWEILCEGRDV